MKFHLQMNFIHLVKQEISLESSYQIGFTREEKETRPMYWQ